MSTEPPELAISVRQPWAWALVHAGKHLENRTAGALRFMLARLKHGPLCIHASLGMTKREYERARDFMISRKLVAEADFPRPCDLPRGAIVGQVIFDHVVSSSASPWWIGPRALVFRDAEAWTAPIACAGELGFFEWQPSAATYAVNETGLDKTKPWMSAWPDRFHPFAKAEGHIIKATPAETADLFKEQTPK